MCIQILVTFLLNVFEGVWTEAPDTTLPPKQRYVCAQPTQGATTASRSSLPTYC